MSDTIARAVFGKLFDVGTDAHFLVDRAHGGIVSANVRAAELLGIPVAAVVGRTFEDFALEPHDITGDGRHDYIALKRADGSPVFVILTVVNIANVEPGLDVVAFIVRDPAERSSREQTLMAKHSALFTAHAELEAAYSELRESQVELETKKHDIAVLAYQIGVNELVGSVAHHINNPLGALHSMIRAVDKEVNELPPEHRGDLDRRIRRITNIAGQIESNVNAIVTAGRSTKQTGLPPQISAAFDAFSSAGERSTASAIRTDNDHARGRRHALRDRGSNVEDMDTEKETVRKGRP